MSYEDALADLKAEFGKKKVLTARDIAPHIGRSQSAQAALRSRKRFPIKPLREGEPPRFSIYAVAHYIGDSAEDAQHPRTEKPAAKSKARTRANAAQTKAASSLPTRRPPSLGKFLLTYRRRIAELEAEFRFHKELFAELEAIEFDRVVTKARGKRPLAKTKPAGLRV